MADPCVTLSKGVTAAINSFDISNLVVNNASTSAAIIGVQLNGIYIFHAGDLGINATAGLDNELVNPNFGGVGAFCSKVFGISFLGISPPTGGQSKKALRTFSGVEVDLGHRTSTAQSWWTNFNII